jgi:predicted O-methyltransferase YrrM
MKEGLPNIAVSPSQGKFLMLQARMIRAERVLEVGTLGGYSTIWLASARKSIKVTTVEIVDHHRDVAVANLKNAGVEDRVESLLGAGLDVLPKLLKEVETGKRQKYDMVFIDADKINNWSYFDLAVQMSRPGACIIVDNVVRRGLLADNEAAQTNVNVQGSRRVVEGAGRDSRVDAVVVQLVGEKNYDGFLVATVNEDEGLVSGND